MKPATDAPVPGNSPMKNPMTAPRMMAPRENMNSLKLTQITVARSRTGVGAVLSMTTIRDLERVRRLFLKPEFEMLPFRSAIDQIDH